jgi:predicted metal-dependent enzyme (double-stranded beta helix superfamily)
MNDSTSLVAQRRQAVSAALLDIRSLAAQPELTDATLDAIGTRLRALAAEPAIWQQADFPIPAGQRWQAYELNEDADGRFALYAAAMLPGHAQPPHDHTTWAVIAGVRGREENALYRRLDDGSIADRAQLEVRHRVLLEAGDSIYLQPADIHSIEVGGSEAALHLHLYGLGLPHLTERRWFDAATGAFNKLPVFSGFPRI